MSSKFTNQIFQKLQLNFHFCPQRWKSFLEVDIGTSMCLSTKCFIGSDKNIIQQLRLYRQTDEKYVIRLVITINFETTSKIKQCCSLKCDKFTKALKYVYDIYSIKNSATNSITNPTINPLFVPTTEPSFVPGRITTNVDQSTASPTLSPISDDESKYGMDNTVLLAIIVTIGVLLAVCRISLFVYCHKRSQAEKQHRELEIKKKFQKSIEKLSRQMRRPDTNDCTAKWK